MASIPLGKPGGVVFSSTGAKIPSVRLGPTCFALAVVLFCTVQNSPGGVRRDDVADSEFLNLAASALYQSVGKFTYSVGSGSYIASGVLISPEWVLTAAHVTAGNNFIGEASAT